MTEETDEDEEEYPEMEELVTQDEDEEFVPIDKVTDDEEDDETDETTGVYFTQS